MRSAEIPVTCGFADSCGIRLALRQRGAGSPVLLINGTAPAMWTGLPDHLAVHHRVIEYDRRSFGDSAGAPGDDALHAGDAAVIAAALPEPPVVVGWSRGGVIALSLAVARPELVRALVLIEPPLWAARRFALRPTGAFLQSMLWSALGRSERGAEAFLRYVLRDRERGDDRLSTLPAELRAAIRRDARAIVADLRAGTGESLTAAQLSRIQVPVHWLLGTASDPSFAVSAEAARAHLPHLSIERVSASTHWMQHDRPDAIVAAVTRVCTHT